MLLAGAIQQFHLANRWQLQWWAVAPMLLGPILVVVLGDRLIRRRR